MNFVSEDCTKVVWNRCCAILFLVPVIPQPIVLTGFSELLNDCGIGHYWMWTGCPYSLAWALRARGCGSGLNALLFVIVTGIFSVAWSDGSRGDHGLCEAFGTGG